MGIAYELEFDLDAFIECMEKQYPARRRIEDHIEKRRLREELSLYDDYGDDERREKASR